MGSINELNLIFVLFSKRTLSLYLLLNKMEEGMGQWKIWCIWLMTNRLGHDVSVAKPYYYCIY